MKQYGTAGAKAWRKDSKDETLGYGRTVHLSVEGRAGVGEDHGEHHSLVSFRLLMGRLRMVYGFLHHLLGRTIREHIRS